MQIKKHLLDSTIQWSVTHKSDLYFSFEKYKDLHARKTSYFLLPVKI